MITRAHIGAIFENDITNKLLSELEFTFPDGRINNFFEAHLELDDPRMSALLERLDAAGFRPWRDFLRPINKAMEFRLTLRREYGKDDFDHVSFLELKPCEDLSTRDIHGEPVYDYLIYRDITANTGRIQLEPRFLRQDVDLAATSYRVLGPVVPSRIRRLFEASNLRAVAFKPTVLVERQDSGKRVLSWEDHGEPWWELTSDVTLPALSPSIDLRDGNNQPIQNGDLSKGCYRFEGLYIQPELHYRASELKKVASFDLAHTSESFGGGVQVLENRPLVASKRFYDVCVRNNLKIDWVPVRIDPD